MTIFHVEGEPVTPEAYRAAGGIIVTCLSCGEIGGLTHLGPDGGPVIEDGMTQSFTHAQAHAAGFRIGEPGRCASCLAMGVIARDENGIDFVLSQCDAVERA